MQIRFETPYQYVFYHHHVKHLLVIWEKEQRKDLYIIKEETPEELVLQYPGETYRETVLQELEPVFFQTLETEEERFPAILGATFSYQKRLIGMYYHQHRPDKEPPYFFEIKNEKLVELSDEDYAEVIKVFANEYSEHISTD